MAKMVIIEGNSNDKDNVRAYMVKGEAGNDGVSPTITPSKSGTQTTLTIVDGAGTKQAVIDDGYSPTVSTSKEDGVTTIEITDLNGTHEAEIVDGIDLTGGVPTDGIIGFDGVAADIPDGYEVIGNNSFVSVGTTAPTNGEGLWINPVSSNLLSYKDFQTKTVNGINIANNHDGTFTISGTATGDVSEVVSDVFVPMTGTWRLLGCPSGGSSSTYMLSAFVGYWGAGSPNIDTGSGTNITYTGNVKIRFYIKSGTTCNNLVFKPMLTTDTSKTINDFEPIGPNIYALYNSQYIKV